MAKKWILRLISITDLPKRHSKAGIPCPVNESIYHLSNLKDCINLASTNPTIFLQAISHTLPILDICMDQ